MLDRWNDWLRTHSALATALLALVPFVTYAGALANQFVYDDEHQIMENPFVLNPRLWPRMFLGSVWSFRGAGVQTNFYRPLQFAVYWLVYRLAGPNPAVFHLFQILLYVATVWLVYRLGLELIQNEVAALVGALLWALHPLHVEAVAWIASMPEVGFGFFYLLAFLLFVRAEKEPSPRLVSHTLAVGVFPRAVFQRNGG
jgi:4-amino-4-deoxy-L-arabinose transferase-like glycosyltransferase